MPAHATHMEILDLVIEKVASQNPSLGQVLRDNRDIAYLGSIAPDIYFLAPDINDEQRDIMNYFLDLYDDVIKPVLEFYDDYIKPIEEGIETLVGPVDDLLCNAITSLADDGEDMISRLQDAMLAGLSTLMAKTINFFELFTPPIQEGLPESDWFWFDMLHYRNTSDYVLNLINKLPGSDQPQSSYEVGLSYAMGHLSHIAADVTGHAFVNQIVGGPYRSHNRRHHIMENFMDVWAFDKYSGNELIGAKLHRRFTQGDTLDSLGTLRAVGDGILDPPQRLDTLLQLLETTFKDTYSSVPHPTRLEGDFLKKRDINMAYWLSLAFLKMSTDSLLPPIGYPTDDLLDEINRQVDELREAVSDTPDGPSAPDSCWSFWESDCDFSWDAFEDWLEFIGDSIVFLGECIVYALNILKELLETLTCALIHTAILPIKAAMWIIRDLLTELYYNFRDSLVIAGIALPSRDYVNNSPLGSQFTQSIGPSASFESYPRRQLSSTLVGGLLFPDNSHLEYPQSQGELPLTMNGPYIAGDLPESFIEDTPMDINLLNDFANAPSVTETRTIERHALDNGLAIGNAVDYSVKLILEAYEMWDSDANVELPNWNLDSDRGYGYKCWFTSNLESLDSESTAEVIDSYTPPTRVVDPDVENRRCTGLALATALLLAMFLVRVGTMTGGIQMYPDLPVYVLLVSVSYYWISNCRPSECRLLRTFILGFGLGALILALLALLGNYTPQLIRILVLCIVVTLAAAIEAWRRNCF